MWFANDSIEPISLDVEITSPSDGDRRRPGRKPFSRRITNSKSHTLPINSPACGIDSIISGLSRQR
jgi:hypothetical protein